MGDKFIKVNLVAVLSVEKETLIKDYMMAWNALVGNREAFMERWKKQMKSENLLEGYQAEKFIEYTDGAVFDGDGYGLYAENAGLYQGL